MFHCAEHSLRLWAAQVPGVAAVVTVRECTSRASDVRNWHRRYRPLFALRKRYLVGCSGAERVHNLCLTWCGCQQQEAERRHCEPVCFYAHKILPTRPKRQLAPISKSTSLIAYQAT